MSGEAPFAPSTSPPRPPQPTSFTVTGEPTDEPMQNSTESSGGPKYPSNPTTESQAQTKNETDNNGIADKAVQQQQVNTSSPVATPTLAAASTAHNSNNTMNSPSGATTHSPSQSTPPRHLLDNAVPSPTASPASENITTQQQQQQQQQSRLVSPSSSAEAAAARLKATSPAPSQPTAPTQQLLHRTATASPKATSSPAIASATSPVWPPTSSVAPNESASPISTAAAAAAPTTTAAAPIPPTVQERQRSSISDAYQRSSPVTQHVSAAPADSLPSTGAVAAPVQEQEPMSDVRSSPPPSPQRTPLSNGYRPLNVKDALTYLDQVKIQFSDQPEIYNKFLDIMKDFKSQAIDTPGVIERVSSLFRGHPSLISGFNTFLPPGYRIECSVDERARNIIKVTTPTGTTTTTDGEPLNLNSATSESRYYQPYTTHQQPPQPQQQPILTSGYAIREQPAGMGMATSTHIPPSQPPSAMTPSSQQHPYTNHHHHPHTTPSPSGQDDPNSSRKAPVEFNHAINYVNKIKNRFSGEPDTYKQFLEILQTYQKEQKPIQEVYAQVQTLFNGANDLLDEFKQFLPEASGAAPGDMSVFFGAHLQGKRGSMMVPSLSTSGNRKKRMSAAGINRMSNVRGGLDTDDDLQPSRATVSAEEAEFFERVKKYIGNKATYRAFLKLLNLFSQQILDQNLLVARVESFIGGNGELFEWFKTLVGYDTKEDLLDNEPRSKEKLDLALYVSYGPSYRRVPKEQWQEQACSGRDTLCREVLNDEYVSHPRWASEDSEFVASKKNHFEEALHRVEEERYDYDLSIEANLNTIALLEPVSKKISVMSLDEKATFRLPPGLGGPSKAIYQHIIKKIYGPERGVEIIELVHDNPVPTVPLLLKRLKQKDDEWKRAQREWNKIWREVESQNYYKALDYQGVTFKSSDKKAMGTKALLGEIENIRSMQPEKRLFLKGRPMVVPDGGSRLPPQFSFSFKDQPTFKDVTRLVLSFLERQDIYSQEECDGLRSVLETFVPAMFDVLDISPSTVLPKGRGQVEGDEDEMMAEADDEGGDDERGMPSSSYDSDGDIGMDEASSWRRSMRPNNGNSTTDKQAAGTQSGSASSQNDTAQRTAEDAPNLSGAVGGGPSPPPEEAVDNDPLDEGKPKPPVITFFGNDTFYCFVRLFQLVYTRLQKMKLADIAYRKSPESTKRANKAALDLNADNVVIHDVEMDFSHGYYHALLDLIDLFFDGTVDQASFEECSRYIFGSKAYIMFTIDKLILLLTRHMHHIMSDVRSRQLVELFRTYRNLEHPPDAQQLATYKLRAEQDVIGPEQNIYGIVFDTGTRILSIQLLDQEDYPLETDARTAYNDYITDFADFNVPTRGIDDQNLKQQFLKRNVTGKRKREDNEDAYVYPGMQYKISKESYHMFYIIDTEDTFIRKRRAVAREEEEKSAAATATTTTTEESKWRSWLESEKGWSRGVDDKGKAEKDAEALLTGKKTVKDKENGGDNDMQIKNDIGDEEQSKAAAAAIVPSSSTPPTTAATEAPPPSITADKDGPAPESKPAEQKSAPDKRPKTPPPSQTTDRSKSPEQQQIVPE
ncbi:hypothetical protein BDB00DRAFT_831346 [Zychaea mexicana]|uniref:uncharacterized protein n=1 Tax=Zychaea mexicana TaxID=64656 RepID=UPI0022FEC164|nr:uncharacterized protein BDB00DRAFT_831346 [Zychaea mexicana]KAI9491761.1 hypothetical protein BDB00DRAFT_831346 [Zychaea mexicana]